MRMEGGETAREGVGGSVAAASAAASAAATAAATAVVRVAAGKC